MKISRRLFLVRVSSSLAGLAVSGDLRPGEADGEEANSIPMLKEALRLVWLKK
jgi:hypothetical protein